jgi:hypothetical protein
MVDVFQKKIKVEMCGRQTKAVVEYFRRKHVFG